MKQKRFVTIVDELQDMIDGKTIHEVIAYLQALDADHSGQYSDIQLDWDGDTLELNGYRDETDNEAQIRVVQEAANQVARRRSELRMYNVLKEKYGDNPDLEEANMAAYHAGQFTPISEVIDELRQDVNGDKEP